MYALRKPSQVQEKRQLDEVTDLQSLSTDIQHELVCVLEYHQNPINCVRFSPNGRLLAACSDDFTVSVYHCANLVNLKNTDKNVERNGSFNKNLEDWNFYKLFRKHNKDVLGVAWSNDSKLLASCSVDNNVLIYDIIKQGKLIQFFVYLWYQDVICTLIGHNDIVKGLAFDPINKYLATQSDKLLILWSTSTWEHKYTIEEPFLKSMGMSLAVLFC